MPISEPYEIKDKKDKYAVRITRKNGTSYVTKSPDYQSILEYRAEFLAEQQKKQRGR